MCCTFVTISVICMLSLDLIASELENPFGEDPNDLPAFSMQYDMNRNLLLMLNPEAWKVPQIEPKTLQKYDALARQRTEDLISLHQYAEGVTATNTATRLESIGLGPRRNKLVQQVKWVKQQVHEVKIDKVAKALNLTASEELALASKAVKDDERTSS